jgi:hypothetical protein
MVVVCAAIDTWPCRGGGRGRQWVAGAALGPMPSKYASKYAKRQANAKEILGWEAEQ